MQGLRELLDAFDEPAFLLDLAGVVVFANLAAQAAGMSGPVTPEGDAALHVGVRRVRFELDGESLELVVPKPIYAADSSEVLPWALPPWMERVAHPLAHGLCDKEIAVELDMPLSSVRTCVARIFRRVGVHSRAEFIAKIGELQRAARSRPR
ncbi:MAG: LuxR C-terminal-related transcriptional regulator [Myxococcota bacterium]